jgi:hypothetical protein
LSLATRTVHAAIAGLFLCLLAAFPAVAHADVQTIDFDTAPPALGSPLETSGSIVFPLGQGLRPYRTDVGLRAHSGTTVGDIGRCADEAEATGGDAGSCEFFQARSTVTLARTATSVTLFAGRFGPVGPFDSPEQATLTAFNAGGTFIATTGPVPIDVAGFNARLSVSSPAGNIARVVISTTSGPNGESEVAGDLGIDDLAVNFADGGAADFALGAPNQIFALVAGQSLDIPVQVNRINGSSGPIAFSLSNLPRGVSAEPVTVSGNQTTATLTLSAAPDAPDTNFEPITATLTADPLGDPNVGPAPRTAALQVRVARDYQLEVDGSTEAELSPKSPLALRLPDCTPLEVPVKIRRDIAMNRDITLTLREGKDGATGLPPGVHAEILPSPVVPPGGNLVAERILRFSIDRPTDPQLNAIVLEGSTGPGSSPHPMEMLMFRARPEARLATPDTGPGLARTQRLNRAGSRVRVTGNGFCPGTQVLVGNAQASAPARLIDSHTIEFHMPRYATNGQVTIVPPDGLSGYRADGELSIDSFRNVNGFQFVNFGMESYSFGELLDTFGEDDLLSKINPCWPFGDCSITTPIPNPSALLAWQIIDSVLGSKRLSGHCFGLSLASQDFTTGKVAYSRYAPAEGEVGSVWELAEAGGPGDSLESFLDVEQAKQASNEFISAWMDRKEPLHNQLELISREFSRNRSVIVSVKRQRLPIHIGEIVKDPSAAADVVIPRGHAMLAYDMVQTARHAEIYVYDSNKPFNSVEEENGTGALHRAKVDSGVIHIDKDAGTWSYQFAGKDIWRGEGDGSLWAIPSNVMPKNLSLPGLGTLAKGLAEIIVGSADGSAVSTQASPGAEFLPTSDAGAEVGAAGTWVSEHPDRPLEVSFLGLKAGDYSQAYASDGFIASTTLATSKGVRDTLAGSAESLRIESGQARPLKVDLASRSGAELSTAATLESRASAQGIDSAGFSEDGALTYAHQGTPTTLDFSLTTVRRDGGPATFVSGPIRVGSDDRLRAEPLDRELRRVKLTIRDAQGHKRTRVLRNQGRPRVRLKLGTPKIAKHRLRMPIGLSGRRARAVLGVSLRLMRGGDVVARKAVALKGRKDRRKISWRLPRSLRGGRYRLLADARAVTSAARGSTTAASVRADRAGWIWIGR